MGIATTTHLNFHGNAREALGFYQSVFGGRLIAVTYGDFGMPQELPDADKVVWGQVESDNGFRVMAYDVPSKTDAHTYPAPAGTRRENGLTLTGEPFFMSVRGDTADEVGALWDKLVDGATVIDSYGPVRWAPAFGMLTDRYGVTWILDVAVPYAG